MDEKETQMRERFLSWSQVCLLQQNWRVDQNDNSSSLVREKAMKTERGENVEWEWSVLFCENGSREKERV